METKRIALSTKEVAERLGFSADRIRRMCVAGQLRAFRIVEHGEWRIAASYIDGLISNRQALEQMDKEF
jgi:excisionase family DNA binding protein